MFETTSTKFQTLERPTRPLTALPNVGVWMGARLCVYVSDVWMSLLIIRLYSQMFLWLEERAAGTNRWREWHLERHGSLLICHQWQQLATMRISVCPLWMRQTQSLPRQLPRSIRMGTLSQLTYSWSTSQCIQFCRLAIGLSFGYF